MATTAQKDKIVAAAYALADARADHQIAVREFGHDRGLYSEVEKTSRAWVKADAKFRKTLEVL